MSVTLDDDNSILPKISTNPLSKEDAPETNNLDAENTNTSTIASGDSSFEEGDEDYDDEQEEIDRKQRAKEGKNEKESYLDYGGNSDANAPAK